MSIKEHTIDDQLQMFQRVSFEEDGAFEHIFFVHGLSHLADEANNRVSKLEEKERLYLSLDCQNAYDDNAVLVRAENPAQIVGYCPRFLANDISLFLKNDNNSIKVFVESISPNAPSNYRLMCKLKGRATKDQINEFMSKDEFKLIVTLMDTDEY